MRRRLRFSRSSIGAVPSPRMSIICPASLDALAAVFPDAFAIVGRALAKPISTSRRMASEREGMSFKLVAQASTRTLRSSGRRIAVTGSRPVAGRPRFFFDIARTGFRMFPGYNQLRLKELCPREARRTIGRRALLSLHLQIFGRLLAAVRHDF